MIVTLSWLPHLVPSLANFSGARALRALRPLRTLKHLPGMPQMVGWVVKAMPGILTLCLLTLFIFFVFGIIGMDLFRGTLHYRCALPGFAEAMLALRNHHGNGYSNGSINGSSYGSNSSVGNYSSVVGVPGAHRQLSGGGASHHTDDPQAPWDTRRLCSPKLASSCAAVWATSLDSRTPANSSCSYFDRNHVGDFASFDSVIPALFLIFKQITGDTWYHEMYEEMLASSPSESVIYFVSGIIINWMVIANLFVAVIFIQVEAGGSHHNPAGGSTHGGSAGSADGGSAAGASEAGGFGRAASAAEGTASAVQAPSPPPSPPPSAAGAIGAASDESSPCKGLLAVGTFSPMPLVGTWAKSQGVELVGLAEHSDLNGCEAKVIKEYEGRVAVWLTERAKVVRVKPENLATRVDPPAAALAPAPSQLDIFREVATSSALYWVSMGAVLVNVALMCMKYEGMDEKFADDLVYGENFCNHIFLVEMGIKLLGLGCRGYWCDRWNALDGSLVLSFVVSQLLEAIVGEHAINLTLLRILRLVRLVRILRVLRSWQSFCVIVATFIRTIPQLCNLIILILLFTFSFALLGMQLFGAIWTSARGYYEGSADDCVHHVCPGGLLEKPHYHFDHWYPAMITVFMALTGKWVHAMEPMTEIAEVGLGCGLFFVAVIVLGKFVLLNFLISVIITEFAATMSEQALENAKLKKTLDVAQGFQAAFAEGIDRSEAGLEAAFAKVDTNQSGNINHEEMKTYILSVYPKLTTKRIAQMIAVTDTNNDGEIDLDEFKAIMRAGPRVGAIDQGLANAGDSVHSRQPDHPNLLDSSIERLITSMKASLLQRALALPQVASALRRVGRAPPRELVGNSSPINSPAEPPCVVTEGPTEGPTKAVVVAPSSAPQMLTFSTAPDHALFCFPPEHWFRHFCRWLIAKPAFDRVVLLMIMISSVCLALDSPRNDPSSALHLTLHSLDYVFAVFFFLEMMAKVVALGFLYGEDAYIKSPWNCVDFFIVVISIVILIADAIAALQPLRVLRIARVLRPLRLISRSAGMRTVIASLFKVMPAVLEVFGITLAIQLVFALIGMEMFMGKLAFCSDPHYETKAECLSEGGAGSHGSGSHGNGGGDGDLGYHSSDHRRLGSGGGGYASPPPPSSGNASSTLSTSGEHGTHTADGFRHWANDMASFNHFGVAMQLLYVTSSGDHWDSQVHAADGR